MNKTAGKKQDTNVTCHWYGEAGYLAPNCHCKDWTCQSCGKKGHLANVLVECVIPMEVDTGAAMSIHYIPSPRFKELLGIVTEIFQGGLGTMKGFEVALEVDPSLIRMILLSTPMSVQEHLLLLPVHLVSI